MLNRLIEGLLSLAASTAFAAGAASAANVAVVAPAARIVVGNMAQVGIVVSGLVAGSAPSLGSYDLTIQFDAAILAFNSAVFGDPVRGHQLNLAGLGTASGVQDGAGMVSLFEVSFDSPAALNAFQLDTFVLATLTFTALTSGSSALLFDPGSLGLGDAAGNSLAAQFSNATLVVTPIPEPASALLLGPGLLVLILGLRLRKAKRT